MPTILSGAASNLSARLGGVWKWLDGCALRNPGMMLLLLLLLALSLRCASFQLKDRHEMDEKYYVESVVAILGHDANWQTAYSFSPLMSLLGAFGCQVSGGSPETVLRILNLMYSLLCVCAVYGLGRDAFSSPRAGLLCGLLLACNPAISDLSTEIMREPLYLLWVALTMWCAVRLIKAQGQAIIWSGAMALCSFLGFLTRVEGVELMVISIAAMAFKFLCKRNFPAFKQLTSAAVAFAVAIGLLYGACALAGLQYPKQAVSQKMKNYWDYARQFK